MAICITSERENFHKTQADAAKGRHDFTKPALARTRRNSTLTTTSRAQQFAVIGNLPGRLLARSQGRL